MMTLTQFAAAAKLAASNASAMSRFGRKSTISGAWAELDADMSLEAFKARLLEAHQAGLLVLSRLDMPGVFPASVVARSRISHMGLAEFHLVAC